MFRMIHYKSAEEIELIRESSLLVSQTHALVASNIRPGITTAELDKMAETFIRDNGAVPAFKGYRGFPATLCISINEEVVHGIPGNREVKDGDVVSVDCGVCKNKFFGDAAYTFPIGEVSEEVLKLLRVTLESLYKGIENAVVGSRMGNVGFAIQEHTELKNGYGVVRDLIGHGVGTNLHEAPDVPNYGRRGQGMLLKDGLVIAIEPMINLGTHRVKQLNDGWTIITADGKPSAHFEHTIAVKKGRADILSDHSIIEDAIKNNKEIKNFK
jgi:methionyl aminopeptidase